MFRTNLAYFIHLAARRQAIDTNYCVAGQDAELCTLSVQIEIAYRLE